MQIFGYEITIKKRKYKKTKGFSAKPCTESEVNTALRLVNEGKSQSEVAKLLNRTTPAVYSKLNKVRKDAKENN